MSPPVAGRGRRAEQRTTAQPPTQTSVEYTNNAPAFSGDYPVPKGRGVFRGMSFNANRFPVTHDTSKFTHFFKATAAYDPEAVMIQEMG